MNSYESAKQEIKRSADIVELIGGVVQLKRAGQNHLGLCPFHSEKDPSFTVSPSRQMFHCFGCKKGGDIFAFWMEYHKVAFPQAMRDLAEKYRISLPKKQLTPSEKKNMELKELLFKLNETAAEYFHHILTKSEKGKPGREYLDKRSIPKEIASQFRLGYAPDEWDGLARFLKRKKNDMGKAVQAGLIIPKKSGGYYDRFRARVVFPIFNLRQQIVGFGGRVLDDSLPKYLNTPETPLFHKGKLFYGLNAAYQKIRESSRAVIVEGYTDVLALINHGFHEAVATLGTALTRDHIRMLKGYAKEAVVVFDPDAAGKAAAMKSLSSFLDEGLSPRVMVLPENDDPDSFVNKNGLDGFLKLLNRSMPMFEFYLDLKLSQGGDEVEGKVDVLKEIIPVLSELNNNVQRSLYVRRLSEKIGIAESAILAELRNWHKHLSLEGGESGLRERFSVSRAIIRDDLPLLNLLIHYPHTMERLINHDFRLLLSDPIIIEIFDAIDEIYKSGGECLPADILEGLEREPTRERFREAMLMPPICRHDEVEQAVKEFEDKVNKIKMSESIKKALKQGDIEGLNKIQKLKRERWG